MRRKLFVRERCQNLIKIKSSHELFRLLFLKLQKRQKMRRVSTISNHYRILPELNDILTPLTEGGKTVSSGEVDQVSMENGELSSFRSFNGMEADGHHSMAFAMTARELEKRNDLEEKEYVQEIHRTFGDRSCWSGLSIKGRHDLQWTDENPQVDLRLRD